MLRHLLGLDNANGPFYLFWSGFGGDLLTALPIIAGMLVIIRKLSKHLHLVKKHLAIKETNSG
jgi:hypothetical protein